jgi:hypothetical protein
MWQKAKISLKRHSGEGRNPEISGYSGCRIKSGMTNLEFFAKPTKFSNVVSHEATAASHRFGAGFF